MKYVVETTGPFQIVGRGADNWARHDRPSVVGQSAFIGQHIANKQLSVLASVSDEATDEALEAAWKGHLKATKADEVDVEAFAAEFAENFALTAAPRAKGLSRAKAAPAKE